jgi:hypothetical protein
MDYFLTARSLWALFFVAVFGDGSGWNGDRWIVICLILGRCFLPQGRKGRYFCQSVLARQLIPF